MMNTANAPIVPEYLRDLTPANEAAYARFLASGLPAPKTEAYKYTNIAQALDFRSPATPATIQPIIAGPNQYVRIKSAVPDDGASGALALLNRALATETVTIHVPDGVKVEEPIYLTWAAPHHEVVNPSVEICVGVGSSVCVVETLSGQNTGWCNRTTTIKVEKGAALKHYRHLGGGGVMTDVSQVDVAADASYDALLVNAGGAMVRHDLNIDLNGERAQARLNAAHLLKQSQHSDLTAVIRHLAPNTSSNQTVRSVLMDKARGVYQGKIYVDRVAQKADGYQLSNALLLSQEAEMDTKPELEIYADDVKCSHGATTGALDEHQLFYLLSRGIPMDAARALLLRGFVAGLFAHLPDNLREMFENRIDGWLL